MKTPWFPSEKTMWILYWITEDFSQSDRAQIEDIVTRKTGCSVSQIIISKMNVGES